MELRTCNHEGGSSKQPEENRGPQIHAEMTREGETAGTRITEDKTKEAKQDKRLEKKNRK